MGMKLQLSGVTKLRCTFCGENVHQTNIEGGFISKPYKCLGCGRWFFRHGEELIQLILNYTPCFGTHGSFKGSPEGRELCPKCLNVIA